MENRFLNYSSYKNNVFNPSNLTDEELVTSFILRKKEFKRIINDIENSDMQYPEQHFIIEGLRGYGKTTLLRRIYIELKNNNELKNKFIPVIFNEEEYSIRRLYKFWENTAKLLEIENDEFEGLQEDINTYSEIEDDEYADICFKLIEKKLKEKNKKLILLIDNIGYILNKFKLNEQQKLRAILLNSAEIRIIGASSEVLEYTFDYSQPFYDFFKQIKLNGLTSEETLEFIKFLGKIFDKKNILNLTKTNKEKIEVLRRLTGGVPRTIVLLFDIFIDNNGDSFKELEAILDKVTPLYKHRMDNLSPVHQELIDVMALNWDAISTKEIADKMRMESKEVSAQLNQLEKNSIINKIAINKKNYMYQIKERFFNLWYLMRFGNKKEQNKVYWLVRFLESWCSKDELEEKTLQHIQSLKTIDVYDKYAYHMSESLSRTNISQERQDELLKETRNFLYTRNKELCNKLSKSDIEIMDEILIHYKNNEVSAYLKGLLEIKNKYESVKYEIDILKNNNIKSFKDTEKYYLEDAEKGNLYAIYNLVKLYEIHFKDYKKVEKYYLLVVEKGNIVALNSLANLYAYKLSNYVEAEKYYLLAIEKGDVVALNNLAKLYANKLNKYSEAEKYYLLAIEKGNVDALFNLANLYIEELSNYDKAEKYYLLAIEKGNVSALNNLANLYVDKLNKYSEAEKYYLLGIEKGSVDALFNLANLYAEELNNYEEAEKYYLLAIEKGDVSALFNLAILYAEGLDNYEEAEKYYLLAIEKGDVNALNNLAILYTDELKNYEEAEKYYLIAIEKGHVSAVFNLAILYADNLNNYVEAEKYYLLAIEKGVVDALNNLAILYADNLNNYVAAEKYYLLAIEKGVVDALNNLANLYADKINNYDEAEKYYLLAIEKSDVSALFNLAILYADKLNNYLEAEKFFILSSEKGNINSEYSLSLMYFFGNVTEKNTYALSLAESSFKKLNTPISAYVLSMISLWNDLIEKSLQAFKTFLKMMDDLTLYSAYINKYFVFLMSKKQFNSLLKFFEDDTLKLKDILKPTYYALLFFMQTQDNKFEVEYKKMGEELKETVEEIIADVKEMQYKYSK